MVSLVNGPIVLVSWCPFTWVNSTWTVLILMSILVADTRSVWGSCGSVTHNHFNLDRTDFPFHASQKGGLCDVGGSIV